MLLIAARGTVVLELHAGETRPLQIRWSPLHDAFSIADALSAFEGISNGIGDGKIAASDVWDACISPDGNVFVHGRFGYRSSRHVHEALWLSSENPRCAADNRTDLVTGFHLLVRALHVMPVALASDAKLCCLHLVNACRSVLSSIRRCVPFSNGAEAADVCRFRRFAAREIHQQRSTFALEVHPEDLRLSTVDRSTRPRDQPIVLPKRSGAAVRSFRDAWAGTDGSVLATPIVPCRHGFPVLRFPPLLLSAWLVDPAVAYRAGLDAAPFLGGSSSERPGGRNLEEWHVEASDAGYCIRLLVALRLAVASYDGLHSDAGVLCMGEVDGCVDVCTVRSFPSEDAYDIGDVLLGWKLGPPSIAEERMLSLPLSHLSSDGNRHPVSLDDVARMADCSSADDFFVVVWCRASPLGPNGPYGASSEEEEVARAVRDLRLSIDGRLRTHFWGSVFPADRLDEPSSGVCSRSGEPRLAGSLAYACRRLATVHDCSSDADAGAGAGANSATARGRDSDVPLDVPLDHPVGRNCGAWRKRKARQMTALLVETATIAAVRNLLVETLRRTASNRSVSDRHDAPWLNNTEAVSCVVPDPVVAIARSEYVIAARDGADVTSYDTTHRVLQRAWQRYRSDSTLADVGDAEDPLHRTLHDVPSSPCSNALLLPSIARGEGSPSAQSRSRTESLYRLYELWPSDSAAVVAAVVHAHDQNASPRGSADEGYDSDAVDEARNMHALLHCSTGLAFLSREDADSAARSCTTRPPSGEGPTRTSRSLDPFTGRACVAAIANDTGGERDAEPATSDSASRASRPTASERQAGRPDARAADVAFSEYIRLVRRSYTDCGGPTRMCVGHPDPVPGPAN